jgi:uncharacterized protein with GYD domain
LVVAAIAVQFALRVQAIGGQIRTRARRANHANHPGSYAMATYIALCNWTDKGAQQVKDSPKRFEAAKKLLRDMGGEIKSFYLTMGDFDLVAIADAPDDAVMARFLMQLGMLGNVRTRTLKAFPEAAYREIVATLS